MSNQVPASLQSLPVELVYRIMDNLDELTILLTFRNVCTRLRQITDTYHPYQVNDFHITISYLMISISHGNSVSKSDKCLNSQTKMLSNKYCIVRAF